MAQKDCTSDEDLFNGDDIIIWDPLICSLTSPLENEPIDIGIVQNLTSCDGSTADPLREIGNIGDPVPTTVPKQEQLIKEEDVDIDIEILDDFQLLKSEDLFHQDEFDSIEDIHLVSDQEEAESLSAGLPALINTKDLIDSPQKRHKKHKHKKHRKRKTEESESSLDLSLEEIDSSKLRHGGKLKIRLPKDGKSDKSKGKPSAGSGEKNGVSSKNIQSGVSPKNIQNGVLAKNLQKKKKGKGKDSGTSSEEERWLDAIESGKLEEVDDELKKIKPKDPKLMTARQRAMFERKTDKDPSPGGEQLMALPSGYKEKVMTAEALQKAALKSQKRKQLADEKREKDMKKIMEKILKKQDSKSGKSKLRSVRTNEPRATLRISANGVTVSMPSGMDFPLQHSKTPTNIGLSSLVRCGVLGCTNVKKYTCTSTGIPLCSLACYRKNMEVALLESVLC